MGGVGDGCRLDVGNILVWEKCRGAAKRRAVARARLDVEVDIPRLAAAMRKYAMAASDRLGSDSYIHAAIVREILTQIGFDSHVVVGHAAWRVGPGDSDVILHAPTPGMVVPSNALPYHVWLEMDGALLDVTTYQLRLKAEQLDAQDGGQTTVNWCPDFLFVPKSSISPLKDVIQKDAGMYHYERNQRMESSVNQGVHELDQDDVEKVWLLYHNPECTVQGPNDFFGKNRG